MFDIIAYLIGILFMIGLTLGCVLLFFMIIDYYYQLLKRKRDE